MGKEFENKKLTLRWSEDFDDVMEAFALEAERRKLKLSALIKYLLNAWYQASQQGDIQLYADLITDKKALEQLLFLSHHSNPTEKVLIEPNSMEVEKEAQEEKKKQQKKIQGLVNSFTF